jgi:hypothetical protein
VNWMDHTGIIIDQVINSNKVRNIAKEHEIWAIRNSRKIDLTILFREEHGNPLKEVRIPMDKYGMVRGQDALARATNAKTKTNKKNSQNNPKIPWSLWMFCGFLCVRFFEVWLFCAFVYRVFYLVCAGKVSCVNVDCSWIRMLIFNGKALTATEMVC